MADQHNARLTWKPCHASCQKVKHAELVDASQWELHEVAQRCHSGSLPSHVGQPFFFCDPRTVLKSRSFLHCYNSINCCEKSFHDHFLVSVVAEPSFIVNTKMLRRRSRRISFFFVSLLFFQPLSFTESLLFRSKF